MSFFRDGDETLSAKVDEADRWKGMGNFSKEGKTVSGRGVV